MTQEGCFSVLRKFYSYLLICHCSTTSQGGFSIDCTKSCYTNTKLFLQKFPSNQMSSISFDYSSLYFFFLWLSHTLFHAYLHLAKMEPEFPAAKAGQHKANTRIGKSTSKKRFVHSTIKGEPLYSLFSSTSFLEFVF